MRDSSGISGFAETPQAGSAEEAQHPPAESEHPGTEINSFPVKKTTKLTKTA
ncbi:multidrug transporter [Heyndrickxia ginsengihumi]|uniref:multidrug transporter n=1 Tax=Heyndrickxia ginsengihumi TaxID=363870 RepID=UPI003D2469D3